MTIKHRILHEKKLKLEAQQKFRQKAYLYFVVMIGITFASIFYYISKSNLYRQGNFIQLIAYYHKITIAFVIAGYNFFSAQILSSVDKGFNDDLMGLPLTGALTLI
jgi:hypothetical protein